MGTEAGESVKPLSFDWIDESIRAEDESKLFYDNALEDEESFDGVSRVEELENILGELLDLWDENVFYIDTEQLEDVTKIFDRAGAILANDSEEYTG